MDFGYRSEHNQSRALACDQNWPTSENMTYFIFKKTVKLPIPYSSGD
jgi:hypothetical protein